MRHPGLRKRLAIFAVLSAVIVTWTGAKYARITDYVIPSTYTVAAELETSGGTFDGAEVTYRGVPVGRVGDVSLSDTGVRAQLLIDKGVRIPADVDANVHNRSAVGEQYVDLVPAGAGTRPLVAGDVIPRSRTSVPLGEEVLVKSLDDFATSVPLDDLRTVVTELGEGFGGSGPDIARILDGTDQLVGNATTHLPATVELLESSNKVMATQVDHASDLRDFAQGLAKFTEDIEDGDDDIRDLLEVAPDAAEELTLLLDGLNGVMPRFLSNVNVLSRMEGQHLPHLEQFLVAFPWSVPGTVAGARHGRAMFVLQTTQEQPICTKGYLPREAWRSTQDGSDAPPNYNVGCTDPALVQRGSHYAPGPTR